MQSGPAGFFLQTGQRTTVLSAYLLPMARSVILQSSLLR